jgi:uncharacterized protein (TIGR00369 family)
MPADHANEPLTAAEQAEFFRDDEFSARFPQVTLPPPSFVAAGGKVLAFEKNRRIVLAFLVQAEQTNPLGTLQGGILASFIDDAFGSLCFASLRKPCVSIDLNINFIRPLEPGEVVTVEAVFKAKNRKLLQVYAEVHNPKGKLAATATSNLLVLAP